MDEGPDQLEPVAIISPTLPVCLKEARIGDRFLVMCHGCNKNSDYIFSTVHGNLFNIDRLSLEKYLGENFIILVGAPLVMVETSGNSNSSDESMVHSLDPNYVNEHVYINSVVQGIVTDVSETSYLMNIGNKFKLVRVKCDSFEGSQHQIGELVIAKITKVSSKKEIFSAVSIFDPAHRIVPSSSDPCVFENLSLGLVYSAIITSISSEVVECRVDKHNILIHKLSFPPNFKCKLLKTLKLMPVYQKGNNLYGSLSLSLLENFYPIEVDGFDFPSSPMAFASTYYPNLGQLFTSYETKGFNLFLPFRSKECSQCLPSETHVMATLKKEVTFLPFDQLVFLRKVVPRSMKINRDAFFKLIVKTVAHDSVVLTSPFLINKHFTLPLYLQDKSTASTKLSRGDSVFCRVWNFSLDFNSSPQNIIVTNIPAFTDRLLKRIVSWTDRKVHQFQAVLYRKNIEAYTFDYFGLMKTIVRNSCSEELQFNIGDVVDLISKSDESTFCWKIDIERSRKVVNEISLKTSEIQNENSVVTESREDSLKSTSAECIKVAHDSSAQSLQISEQTEVGGSIEDTKTKCKLEETTNFKTSQSIVDKSKQKDISDKRPQVGEFVRGDIMRVFQVSKLEVKLDEYNVTACLSLEDSCDDGVSWQNTIPKVKRDREKYLVGRKIKARVWFICKLRGIILTSRPHFMDPSIEIESGIEDFKVGHDFVGTLDVSSFDHARSRVDTHDMKVRKFSNVGLLNMDHIPEALRKYDNFKVKILNCKIQSIVSGEIHLSLADAEKFETKTEFETEPQKLSNPLVKDFPIGLLCSAVCVGCQPVFLDLKLHDGTEAKMFIGNYPHGGNVGEKCYEKLRELIGQTMQVFVIGYKWFSSVCKRSKGRKAQFGGGIPANRMKKTENRLLCVLVRLAVPEGIHEMPSSWKYPADLLEDEPNLIVSEDVAILQGVKFINGYAENATLDYIFVRITPFLLARIHLISMSNNVPEMNAYFRNFQRGKLYRLLFEIETDPSGLSNQKYINARVVKDLPAIKNGAKIVLKKLRNSLVHPLKPTLMFKCKDSMDDIKNGAYFSCFIHSQNQESQVIEVGLKKLSNPNGVLSAKKPVPAINGSKTSSNVQNRSKKNENNESTQNLASEGEKCAPVAKESPNSSPEIKRKRNIGKTQSLTSKKPKIDCHND